MHTQRNWMIQQKGAFVRRVPSKHYSYIGPRIQYPLPPERPLLYFAEGAESVNSTASRQQRLLCAGQIVKIKDATFTIVTLFWCGAKHQGKNRYSPRSEMYVLLLADPERNYNITAANNYARAQVEDLFHPASPDPICNAYICRETFNKMVELASNIISKKKDDVEWWERPVLVRSARADKAAAEEEARQAAKRRATSERRRKQRLTKKAPTLPTKRVRIISTSEKKRKKTTTVQKQVKADPTQPAREQTQQRKPTQPTREQTQPSHQLSQPAYKTTQIVPQPTVYQPHPQPQVVYQQPVYQHQPTPVYHQPPQPVVYQQQPPPLVYQSVFPPQPQVVYQQPHLQPVVYQRPQHHKVRITAFGPFHVRRL